nr:hypothetical protein [Micromonospora sp. DSM 115978]
PIPTPVGSAVNSTGEGVSAGEATSTATSNPQFRRPNPPTESAHRCRIPKRSNRFRHALSASSCSGSGSGVVAEVGADADSGYAWEGTRRT